MFKIQIRLQERSYSIIVGQGEATTSPALRDVVEPSTKAFLITNHTIWKKYARLVRAKGSVLASAFPLLIPDGERFKNTKWYENLCREIVRHGADRRTVIVALGGGVVGDLSGFVAATVLRGLRLVQMPTTLLAQIDSSIGCETAVNLPEGKNMIGAFYQPALVVTDPQFLRTLPLRELKAGLYEAVKYGVVLDRELFELIEGRRAEILSYDLDVIEEVIRHCASVKAEIVGRDERESGTRMLLNFGHTIGHGLEAATAYRRFKHGEAVGWGSMIALRLAENLMMISREDSSRMTACLQAVGALPKISDLPFSSILTYMRHDKKAMGGKIHFVLPTGIGSGQVVSGIDVKLIRESYLEIQKGSTISKKS